MSSSRCRRSAFADELLEWIELDRALDAEPGGGQPCEARCAPCVIPGLIRTVELLRGVIARRRPRTG
jgi:hypothetical protein